MQNGKNNIVIFSRPIRSGKTTELFDFINHHKNTGGFLTPDKDGQRWLYDIAAQFFYRFEIEDGSTEPAIAVGKFRFSVNAFNKAKQLFNHTPEYDLFVLDEVGKLEVLHNSGFEPELGLLINRYASGERKGMLLLVVRDTLVESAIAKYGLKSAPVINSLTEVS